MIDVRDIIHIVLTVVCVVVTLYLLWALRRPIGWLLAAIFLAIGAVAAASTGSAGA